MYVRRMQEKGTIYYNEQIIEIVTYMEKVEDILGVINILVNFGEDAEGFVSAIPRGWSLCIGSFDIK